ncbi:MAG: hypothetical protein ACXAC6_15850 [Candidatus Hodarchaeales archaeon]
MKFRDPIVPFPLVIQAADGGFLISAHHLMDTGGNDWDVRLIKAIPIQDTSSTPSITTTVNGTFGFSALLILVVLIGFYSLRRRR